jgi:hypothetical protein
MNKKSQFFIMFAVIFGLLLLSTASRFNSAFSSSKNLIEEFQRTCKNYRYEVFVISQNFTLGEPIDELAEIKNLTNYFVTQKNVEIFFIYGNKSDLVIQNNLTDNLTIKINSTKDRVLNNPGMCQLIGEDVRNITVIFPFSRFFNISENKAFYSVLRLKKENEVYYC